MSVYLEEFKATCRICGELLEARDEDEFSQLKALHELEHPVRFSVGCNRCGVNYPEVTKGGAMMWLSGHRCMEGEG